MLHGITAGTKVFVPPALNAITGQVVGTARNESYSAELAISGGIPPYIWTISAGALPAGLALDPDTGEITGVVPVSENVGYFTFTVRADDSAGQFVTRAFTMGVGDYIVLVPMNGSNGGTAFPDSTARVWTRNGNLQTVTDGAALGGSAGSFDGTGDYLTTPHDVLMRPSADLTVEGFFYPDTVTTLRVIYTKRQAAASQDFEVLTNTSGQLTFAAWGAGNASVLSLNTVDTINLGVWNHFACSIIGTTWFIHLNGVYQGAGTPSGAVAQGTTIAYIGRTPQFTARDFDGKMAQFRWMRGAARYRIGENFDVAAAVALSNFPVVP